MAYLVCGCNPDIEPNVDVDPNETHCGLPSVQSFIMHMYVIIIVHHNFDMYSNMELVIIIG